MSTPAPPTPKERNLYLSSQVTQSSMLGLVKDILAIERDDRLVAAYYQTRGMDYKPEPIQIYIDSYGGECYSCFGLLSVMDLCTTPIRTIVTGCAMSCGFLIAISGHERIAYPHATFMHHGVSAYTEGKLGDMKVDLEEAMRLQNIGDSRVVRRTKITKAQLRKLNDQKADWYLNPSEALRLGVVHSIAKTNVL